MTKSASASDNPLSRTGLDDAAAVKVINEHSWHDAAASFVRYLEAKQTLSRILANVSGTEASCNLRKREF